MINLNTPAEIEVDFLLEFSNVVAWTKSKRKNICRRAKIKILLITYGRNICINNILSEFI